MFNLKTIIQGIFISLAVWLIMYLILDFSNINKTNQSLYPQNRYSSYGSISHHNGKNNSFLYNIQMANQKASNVRIKTKNNNLSGLTKNPKLNSELSDVDYSVSESNNFSKQVVFTNNNDNLYNSDYPFFSNNKRNPKRKNELQNQASNINMESNGLNLGFLQKVLIAENDNLLNQSDLTSDNQFSKVDENPGEPDYGTVPVGNGLWLLLLSILFYLSGKLNWIRFFKNKS